MGLARGILQSRAGNLTRPCCGSSGNGLQVSRKRYHRPAKALMEFASGVEGQSILIAWRFCRTPGYAFTVRGLVSASEPTSSQHSAVANGYCVVRFVGEGERNSNALLSDSVA